MTTLPLFSPFEEEEEKEALAEPGGPGLTALREDEALADLGGLELTPPQCEAVERRDGPLFVHAGAGSGKTRVLVERFVRAVLEDGVPVERMLAITFTEKAAAELRARIRARFLAAGEREHARAADSAWVSTIHGFCSRLLRAHAVSAGLDPEYRVLAEHEAERLAVEAFDAALEDFLGPPHDAARVALAAAHGPDRLAGALRSVHAQMRGRGEREPTLPRPPTPESQQLREAHERLARAVRAAHESLAGETQPGSQVRAALDRLEGCTGALDRLEFGGVLDPLELRSLAVRRGNARALRGELFDEVEEAHVACLELCGRTRALADLRLLDELLGLYASRYARLKTERSALDFDDLELLARDLLRDRPALRERARERFDHVFIDELQDTNGLQSEILDLVSDGNLFAVGDDLQSIYGFRGADVGVFAERRRAASAIGREVRLSDNFRSRGEILDVLNVAFGPVFEDGFAPLTPAGSGRRVEAGRAPLRAARCDRGEEPGPAPCVELLAVDRDNRCWSEALDGETAPFGTTMRGAPPWRAAEARALAQRVDELLEQGEFAPGEVALLLRSWADVGRYEQALAERGVATYVAGGGGYWSGQQVADLRAYLATLANPRDEEALLSVLASPLVGASLDALALLRLRAGRGRGLWFALEAAFGARPAEPAPWADELVEDLPAADRNRLSAFVRRLEAERGEIPCRSPAELIERAISASGYDEAVLAMPGGERRMANLRKLERLARELEDGEGGDLRGFVDWIDRRGMAAAREGDAPLEGEGIDAVRLMTIHAAKGLEFPLVCVGDLGRGDPCDTPLVRVSACGRVGLRLPDPDGGALDALDARALAEEAARAELAEERRLMWVAATRAQRRLIVSGALDLESARPGGGAAMDWLAPALVPELREAYGSGESAGISTRPWTGREACIAWRVISPRNVEDWLPPADRRPLETAASDSPHPPLRAVTAAGQSSPSVARSAPSASAGATTTPPPRPLALPAAPPGGELTRVSYSALESYRRCGYRFYLERRLGLEAGDPGAHSGSSSETPVAPPLSARTRGAVVHELLEQIDPRRGLAPEAARIDARLRAHGATATDREVSEVTRLLEGFLASPLRARMARAAVVRRELPFTFSLAVEAAGGRVHPVLVDGVLDAHCREGAGALVVDYKTDRLAPGADLDALCERAYSTQRLVYALAALRAGAEHVEVAHVFLERPEEAVLVRHEASDGAELERRLGALVGQLVAGRYGPSSAPGAELCHGCPGRAALCSWPLERTGAPAR